MPSHGHAWPSTHKRTRTPRHHRTTCRQSPPSRASSRWRCPRPRPTWACTSPTGWWSWGATPRLPWCVAGRRSGCYRGGCLVQAALPLLGVVLAPGHVHLATAAGPLGPGLFLLRRPACGAPAASRHCCSSPLQVLHRLTARSCIHTLQPGDFNLLLLDQLLKHPSLRMVRLLPFLPALTSSLLLLHLPPSFMPHEWGKWGGTVPLLLVVLLPPFCHFARLLFRGWSSQE